mmetsp:Transcript_6981/g.23189  ORF Transcript_6981/g.23189 Transcript_6981/m.23189 type:complete len:338 (-) Transcript_6981:166-1179(-)
MRSPSSACSPLLSSETRRKPSWLPPHSAKKVAAWMRCCLRWETILWRTISSRATCSWFLVQNTREMGALLQWRVSRRRHMRTDSNQLDRFSGGLVCSARRIAVTSAGVKLTSESKRRKHCRAVVASRPPSPAAKLALASKSWSPWRRARAVPPPSSGAPRLRSPCSSARTASASSSEIAIWYRPSCRSAGTCSASARLASSRPTCSPSSEATRAARSGSSPSVSSRPSNSSREIVPSTFACPALPLAMKAQRERKRSSCSAESVGPPPPPPPPGLAPGLAPAPSAPPGRSRRPPQAPSSHPLPPTPRPPQLRRRLLRRRRLHRWQRGGARRRSLRCG